MRVGPVEGHTWCRAHDYLAELNSHASALARATARDMTVNRRSVAREAIARMIDAVEARCAQARVMRGLEPLPFVAAEDVPEEE